MSDVQQRSQHRRSIGGLVLELAMIGVGVFLGASAEQWRETRHHNDLAIASLRNFRREVADNRAEAAGCAKGSTSQIGFQTRNSRVTSLPPGSS